MALSLGQMEVGLYLITQWDHKLYLNLIKNFTQTLQDEKKNLLIPTTFSIYSKAYQEIKNTRQVSFLFYWKERKSKDMIFDVESDLEMRFF